jgi:excinuclease ABC subunit B
LAKLKEYIAEVDPKAFAIFTNVKSINGWIEPLFRSDERPQQEKIPMDQKFQLKSPFKPTGTNPKHQEISGRFAEGRPMQVLLGATGTGKTFTMANVIEKVQPRRLFWYHNKTLADNCMANSRSYSPKVGSNIRFQFRFLSTEAICQKPIPTLKKTLDKREIELLRTSAVNSLVERADTIIVASCFDLRLYRSDEYKNWSFWSASGRRSSGGSFFKALIDGQYKRNNLDLAPGTFRVRGDVIEIVPANTDDYAIKIDTFGDEIERIAQVDLLTGEVKHTFNVYYIFPAYTHASTHQRVMDACHTIALELNERLQYFTENNKLLEAQRLEMRTKQDIESMQEFGTCPRIENYTATSTNGRRVRVLSADRLLPKDFLLVIDESHVTFPQVRGMYNGDRSRKTTLVEYGFRLPSALDNRPLKFDEFEQLTPQVICTSATPGDYELERCHGQVVEQIIRPTGLVDPRISIRPTLGQIDDLINEINSGLTS